MIKFLDLYAQYQSIENEVNQAMADIIKHSAFIGGAAVKSFEANFAQFQHAKHCLGVGNGTDALEIALEALQLPPGAEIIVAANSFIASSEAITRSGFKVVFCDCDSDNYGLSIASLGSKISDKTAAIMVVHLYGHPCDMDAIMALAQQHSLKIIEDCAQAHGAEYKGQRVGAIGDIGTFSFYPGKNLGAYGDGGAIVTNDDDLALKVRKIANHGRVAKYDHEFEGRNSRLDGLQAAILNVKLNHLEQWTNQRIAVADGYTELLADCDDIVLPKRAEWARQSYHLYVIRTEKRDELKQYLTDNGVQSGIHYPIALPKLAAYQYLAQGDEPFFAHETDSTLLSLPIGEHLSMADVKKVAQTVKAFFA